MLAGILDKKLLDRKLSFWLPLRAIQAENKVKGKSYFKELNIDFTKPYNKEELEKELIAKFNKIEIKKIDEKFN